MFLHSYLNDIITEDLTLTGNEPTIRKQLVELTGQFNNVNDLFSKMKEIEDNADSLENEYTERIAKIDNQINELKLQIDKVKSILD